MEVKLIPIAIACAVALILAQANVTVILAGGVGKNGSTVAVKNVVFVEIGDRTATGVHPVHFG